MYWCESCEYTNNRKADFKKHIKEAHKRDLSETEHFKRRHKANITHTIHHIIHKYGPSPYSDTETEELKTPDEVIEYILYDMVCDNRLTLKQIEDYTLDEVYDCVLRECISKILQYNGLDLEESVEECKEFLAENYKVVALNESVKVKLFKTIDEMRMERIKNKRHTSL
jgi:hypothetical protein